MTDRFTLAAITVVAVLAACLTVAFLPGAWLNPALTWAVAYTGAVLGMARATGLHPGRTLVGSALMLAAMTALMLTTLRAVIDIALRALHALAQLNTRGIDALKEATA